MAVLSIQNLLLKFGTGKSPGGGDYLDLIDTLADDRNAVYFSATAPTDTEANPLWFNTTTNVLSVYDGEWFTTPGPQGATGSTGAAGATGATGATGAAGAAGSTGAAGQGVPVGGTTGQVLSKIDGTNYNTQWVAQSGGSGATDSDQNILASQVFG